jgi:hypothetical protein
MAGCNPVALGLSRFESYIIHQKFARFVYLVRTLDFQSGKTGSNPVPSTKIYLSKVLSGCIRGLGPWGYSSNLYRETSLVLFPDS